MVVAMAMCGTMNKEEEEEEEEEEDGGDRGEGECCDEYGGDGH